LRDRLRAVTSLAVEDRRRQARERLSRGTERAGNDRREGRLRLRGDGLHWRDIEGEVVALEERASLYFAANPSGALLWNALAEGATHEALVSALVERYQLDPDAAREDVDRFLHELAAHGLLEA
jgi:hypothetical protein